MAKVQRVGISIDGNLLKRFDRLVASKGYSSRSLAIADMMRDRLVEEEWHAGNREAVGAVAIVYDHHRRELEELLTKLQHEHFKEVVSTVHVHLDHDNCLEVLVVRGKAKRIRAFAEKLIARRGVKHGKLAMTTTGKGLS